ncbi:MAG: hypothetical protein BA865_02585 [Desulfobacterales bacterium S5133MH4]|nr:MAG: hypothetical protein BA865_02585 [Desulfobacterales bacterium S5133MH4]
MTHLTNELKWAAALVLTISITGLTIVFRRQLAQFFKGVVIKNIRIRFFGIEVSLENLQKVQGQMKSAGIPKPASGDRGGSSQRPGSEAADLSARDIVLDSWGSLKQIVYDAAASRRLVLTQATGMPEAVERLLGAKLITSYLAEPIKVLYLEGKKVVDNPGKVDKEYALVYQELAKSLVDWMMLNILYPEQAEESYTQEVQEVAHGRSTVVGEYFPQPRPGQHPYPEQAEESYTQEATHGSSTVVGEYFPQPRPGHPYPEQTEESYTQEVTHGRSTVVGGYLLQPRPGHPVALLVGIGGPMQGQRFSIDKEHYRIGRNPDNDLCITGDDYVSGNHAYIRYEKGNLFLSDQGSRNGTLLNEKQVTGTALMVRQGNHIRIGKSVFQVSKAPGSPQNAQEKKGPDASRRSKRTRVR